MHVGPYKKKYKRKLSLVYVYQYVARAEGKCVGHTCAQPVSTVTNR